MESKTITKGQVAIIYARVSTKSQDPLSQVIRCEEYCKQKGYTVEQCFEDKITGGGDFRNRPAMQELLAYVKARPHKNYIVVFDDIKRFARDVEFHLKLRTVFDGFGLTPECLNYHFDSSPEGRFMETIHAAQAELERHQNRRQVIQKQRARLIAGYNAFNAHKGYKKIKDPEHGTIDVPNEHARYIRKAMKAFAEGDMPTRLCVAKYLKSKGVFGGQSADKYLKTVRSIFTNVYYAGYIEYLPWEVERRKAKHKGLISLEEFNTIQHRLGLTAHYKPVRKYNNPDFPLRGIIHCYYCKEKYTACKSKGNGGYYHKYYCRNKKCPLRSRTDVPKSVDRDTLHAEFEELLRRLTPRETIFDFVKPLFIKLWEAGIDTAREKKLAVQKKQNALHQEIEVLMTRLTNPTVTASMQARYEQKIADLEGELSKITQELVFCENGQNMSRTTLERAFNILKNPYKIWVSGALKEKMALFKILFSDGLEYLPGQGCRTKEKCVFVKLLEELQSPNSLCVNSSPKMSNHRKELLSTFIHQFSNSQYQS